MPQFGLEGFFTDALPQVGGRRGQLVFVDPSDFAGQVQDGLPVDERLEGGQPRVRRVLGRRVLPQAELGGHLDVEERDDPAVDDGHDAVDGLGQPGRRGEQHDE